MLQIDMTKRHKLSPATPVTETWVVFQMHDPYKRLGSVLASDARSAIEAAKRKFPSNSSPILKREREVLEERIDFSGYDQKGRSHYR